MAFTGLQDTSGASNSILSGIQVGLRKRQIDFEEQQAIQAELRRQQQEDAARQFYASQSGQDPSGAMFAGAPLHALQANYDRGLQRQDQVFADQLRQNNQIQDEERRRSQDRADAVGYLPSAFPGQDWTGTSLSPDSMGPPEPSALSAYSLPPDLVRGLATDNMKAAGDAARFPTELDQKVQLKGALAAQAQETKKQRYIAAFTHFTRDQNMSPERANMLLAKQFPEFAAPISGDEIQSQLGRLQGMGVDPLRMEAIRMKMEAGGDPSSLIGQEATRHSVAANERAKLEGMKVGNQYAQQLVQDRADEEIANRAVAAINYGIPPTPGMAVYAQYQQAVAAANAAAAKRIKTEQAMIGARIAVPSPTRNDGPVPGPMTGQPQAGVPTGQDPFASALQQAMQQAGPGATEDQIFQLADRIRAAGGSR